jgi:hypothetical protein
MGVKISTSLSHQWRDPEVVEFAVPVILLSGGNPSVERDFFVCGDEVNE